MTSSIHSQGFGFGSFMQEGVDPRTGQFTATVTVYEAPSEVRNCPSLKLSLSYNPLNQKDVGLGTGWAFNLSGYYHREPSPHRTLSLSTGERFQVTETASVLFVNDQKLKSFQFKKRAKDEYEVALKSGQVEVLSNAGGTYDTTVPITLYAANGRSLGLTWKRVGEQPRLSEIHDGSQCLFKIKYLDARVHMIRSPGTGQASTLTAKLRNNRLMEISLPPEGAETPSWKFAYETCGQITCLARVKSPAGLVEDVTHNPTGHQLPDGAPYKTIPYVVSHTQRPGGQQPPIKTTYSFSARNFLAYAAGFNWKEGQDNLYRARADYQYTSEVTVEGGPRLKYTYNKFHLIASTEQRKGTKQVTQAITYHLVEGAAFQDQPAHYQLPKTTQTTYQDGSSGATRAESTQHDFDDWGNLIREVLPSGIVTTRTYYAAGGEEARDPDTDRVRVLCPADPRGFQRYVKAVEVTPAITPYETPTRASHHTYCQLPTATGAPVGYFVAANQSEQLCDGRSVARVELAYVNEPAGRDHGRIQQQVASVGGQVATVSSWAYNYPAGANAERIFIETIQRTGHGGRRAGDESTSYSLSSGLTVDHVAPDGARVSFQYDALGRLVQSTASPGTPYEAVRRQEYAFLEGEAGQCMAVTDAKGVQTRYISDGLGRIRRVERQDDDGQSTAGEPYNGTFHTVQERSYNALGQAATTTEIDWFRTNTGDVVEQRRSRSFEYDDWGKVCRESQDGRLATLTVTNPITLTTTVGVEGEGRPETQFDLSGLPTHKRLIKTDGTISNEMKYAYDGIGRLVKEEDGLGHTKEYRLDCFDRVIATILPGGRETRVEYAPYSIANLPISMSMNGSILAEQFFDGQGRAERIMCGGRTTIRTFEGNEPRPSQIITPRRDRQVFAYESALDHSLKALRTRSEIIDYDDGSLDSNTSNAYERDLQSAAVVRCENRNTAESYRYLPSGLLEKHTTQFRKEGEVQSAEATYSMCGKLQSYTDVHGRRHEVQYDEFGRPSRLQLGNLQMVLDYDAAGRVRERHAWKEGDTLGLTTAMAYDDFGREIERTARRGQLTVYRLRQTYGKIGLIDTREVVDGDGNLSRRECFQYDCQNHLVDYSCEGSDPPVDGKGRGVRRQRFTFDNWDNITEALTEFTDRSANTATYSYDSSHDATQLMCITNTHPEYPPQIDLAYDGNGCLTRDERGQILEYDGMNRLRTVRHADGQVLCQYEYDANGKLVRQTQPGKPDRRLYYLGDSIAAESEGDRKTSYAFDGQVYWGQSQENGKTKDEAHQLWTTDSHASALASLDYAEESRAEQDMINKQQYTPYGHTAGACPVGFNGQRRDPVTGWYHLGNGRRVYNPELMRFHSPDPLGPFVSGEVNAYAYCLGDPINRVDPSGCFSLFGLSFSWRDVFVAGLGLAAGIVAGVLTGGAGFALAAGVAIAVGVASDVAAGMAYDLVAGGKGPTWESIGTDALTGLVGGVLGEGVGRVLAVGIKAAARGATTALGRRAARTVAAAAEKVEQGADGAMLPSLAWREATGRYYNIREALPIFDSIDGRLGHEGFLTHGTKEGKLMFPIKEDLVMFMDATKAAKRIKKELNPALAGQRQEFTLFACYGAERESGAGQAFANVLDRNVRCFYGEINGIPYQHRFQYYKALEEPGGLAALYSRFRSSIRRPQMDCT
ncbi:hypothetical protein GGS24DRAFT_517731 [Hypoxylon argillaceum]|nr:hypothetical protein GGS24DRAFT_517731 [Hypoxylon argillaceum]